MSTERRGVDPIGPYAPVIRAGDFLFCSGQLGMVDGELVSGGAAAEIAQACANLSDVLSGEGATLNDVVKTTVFLTDIKDFESMNDAYLASFGRHRPARSTIVVAALPRQAQVEIEATAYRPLGVS